MDWFVAGVLTMLIQVPQPISGFLSSCTLGQDKWGNEAYVGVDLVKDQENSRYFPVSDGKCPDRVEF